MDREEIIRQVVSALQQQGVATEAAAAGKTNAKQAAVQSSVVYERACGSRYYPSMKEYASLFAPGHIGGLEVKNRFVMPAMGTNFANPDGSVSRQMIDYYTARARGGFGLIVIEVTAVDPVGRAIPYQGGLWSDDFIPGWKKLIDSVHQYGAKIAVQLHHCGRQTDRATIGGAQPVAPSPISCPVKKTLPRELTTAETYEIIDKFGQAAGRALAAGFDAIEFNGAHGYLIAQFMSPYANKRVDEFGGDFKSRLRFPVEILRRVRREVGNGFPLIFRMSGEDKVHGGRSLRETQMIARVIEENGANALSISNGTYASLHHMSAPGALPPGHNVYAAEAVKQVVSLPVITAGRINDPDLAKAIIADGKADFVALGRVSIADPEFPNKTAVNATDEISPCIACLQGCVGYLFDPDQKKISCLVNPFVGREGDWQIRQTSRPKKIVVAGGGPAGLEAAWIAAKRGHTVVCYEKEPVLGGQFRLAGVPSTKQDILTAIKYYVRMGEKYGVTYKLGTEFTANMLAVEKPDAVLLTTGGVPLIPRIKGIENPRFVNAVDVLGGKCSVGSKVLVVGGGLVGAETADFIGEYGSEVTIIEFKPAVAADVQAFVRKYLLERLREYGVKLLTGAKVMEFLDDGVIYENTDGGAGAITLRGFDSIVLAMGARSYNPLEEELKGKVAELYVIGDALKAGKAITAIEQAAEIGVTV